MSTSPVRPRTPRLHDHAPTAADLFAVNCYRQHARQQRDELAYAHPEIADILATVNAEMDAEDALRSRPCRDCHGTGHRGIDPDGGGMPQQDHWNGEPAAIDCDTCDGTGRDERHPYAATDHGCAHCPYPSTDHIHN